jgi:alpha-1,2-mannosyltransferase
MHPRFTVAHLAMHADFTRTHRAGPRHPGRVTHRPAVAGGTYHPPVRAATDPDPRVTPSGDRADFARLLPPFLAVLGGFALAAVAIGDSGSIGRGYDFRAYWDAGERVLAGASAYDPATLAGPFRTGGFGLYLYPPPLAVLLLPLHALGYEAADALWVVARIAALVAACAILPVPRWIRFAVFGATALASMTLVDLNLGNVSIVVLALAAVGWRYLDRPAGAGAIAVAVALRSPFAVLLAWQAVRHRWRALAWTLGAGIALILVTLPFVGVQGYLDYVRVLGNLRDTIGVPNNADLGSTALALGAPPAVATLALFAGYATALATALFAALRRDAETSYITAVGATLLLSPVLWGHYLVLLALPAALLAARRWPLAVLLPLLGWLPDLCLPLVALAATVAPLLAGRSWSPDPA